VTVDLLMTQPLAKSCVAALRRQFTLHDYAGAADPAALLAEVGPRIRGCAGGKVNAELMGKLPALEIIANSGVGVDSIDLEAARARGIRVTNTPDVLNDAVAELAISLMLALARQIPQADRFVRDGKWLAGQYPITGELKGKTLGIVGLGRIGKEIAARASALKMRIVYHGRHKQPDQPFDYYDDLVAMARDADWLLIITPGGKGTDRLISREVLEALGPQGRFVNIARGSVVDQAALVDLLTSGGLGGAALDVFEKEPNVPEALFGLGNVVLSPHQGSKTAETRDAMGALLVENLTAHFAGRPLPTPVV
jgi:lactate dehydrogenase-like 2-hydroxyacid dehydrogenase